MSGSASAAPPPRTVVLGLGNILLGDEGVGVRVVVADGRPHGTGTALEPEFSGAYPAALTPHDFGLKKIPRAAERAPRHFRKSRLEQPPARAVCQMVKGTLSLIPPCWVRSPQKGNKNRAAPPGPLKGGPRALPGPLSRSPG